MRSKDIAFKVEPCAVSHSMASALRIQIQYYFSLRNLITDHFLRNIINTSKGGWVDIQIIATFKQIQKFFNQHFQNATEGVKRMVVKKSCEGSGIVEVDNYSIRRKQQTVTVEDFSSVFYFQGKIESAQIRKKLAMDLGFENEKIGVREGNLWFFVQLVQENSTKTDEIYQILKKEVGQIPFLKILRGNEFIEAQNQYTKLIGITPLETPNKQSESKYKLPPSRIISYNEAQQFKTARKTRIIKPKGKHNRSRLPKMFIHNSNPKKSTSRGTKEELIELQGFEARQLKKTPEEIILYRKRKIEEKKRRKADRANSSKMEIEQARDGVE